MAELPNLPLRSLLSADFRDGGASAAKPAGTFRVLVVGDSYAYGLGVRAGEAMPAQLERVLRRRGGPLVEVLNAGRPGLNLVEAWAVVRHVSAAVDYDLLLLTVSSDDAQPWSRQELARLRAPWRQEWAVQWHPEGGSLPHALSALLTVAREIQAAGRRLAVAFYEPVTSSAELPLAILADVCPRLGAPFVDLVTPFARFDRARMSVSAADHHPSPLAHRIAAVELGRALEPYLPDAAAAGFVSVEAALLARLQRAAEASRHPASAELYRCVASAPGAPASVLAAFERLRRAQNRYGRAAHRWASLRALRLRLGEIAETSFRLDRCLLLAEMGVAEARGDEDAAPALADAQRLAGRVEALLDDDGAAAGASDEPSREAEGCALVTEIDRLAGAARRLADERAAGARGMRDEVVAVCRRAAAVAARPARPIHVAPAVSARLGLLVESLRRMVAELEPFGDDEACELSVEVEVPVERAPYHLSLVVTHTALEPWAHRTRQRHYVVQDGARHRYAVDLPAGTTGYVTAELECSDGPEQPARSAGGELITSMALVQGAAERAYRMGDLVLAPVPRELDRGGSVPP